MELFPLTGVKPVSAIKDSWRIDDPESLRVVVATDCGSTTTKAILFEKKNDGWHATYRGEAPTTVERPLADVTIGAMNAFSELEELSGRKFLSPKAGTDGEPPFLRRNEGNSGKGIDLYVSTSSAGGGLQMVVAGVVSAMTTESAERAALGAGAIVMDAISIDDGREQHERVQKIRHLRPDIVLIAGGVEGGTVDHPLELAETILAASPRPRFGDTLKLPIIYAANSAAQKDAKALLDGQFEFHAVENLRPSLERENLAPARDAIHELFLHHVMSHAPGYRKLLSWSPVPVLPTPAAFGNMVQSFAATQNLQVLAVDIGGATTDVFSVVKNPADQQQVFNRTVSANLGMSYSVGNVLLESGEGNIRRWLPFDLAENEIADRLRNKMIRPTTIPQTLDDLILEQAVAREALRLAFEHHRRLASGLKGIKRKRTLSDLFRQNDPEAELLDLLHLDLIIGSGGVLSHAPDRRSAALMIIDAYQPLGVTALAVDSVFMMPHLGVFASVHPKAASDIFLRDCLIPLGAVVAPKGTLPPNAPALRVQVNGEPARDFTSGTLTSIPLEGERPIVVTPLHRSLDIGSGPGNAWKGVVHGGHAGLVIDLRGRPLMFPEMPRERIQLSRRWYEAFGLQLP